jgi:hypothetical protein
MQPAARRIPLVASPLAMIDLPPEHLADDVRHAGPK